MTRISKPGYVERLNFDSYKEKFKNFFHMERKDGVILLRMHHKNKVLKESMDQAKRKAGKQV